MSTIQNVRLSTMCLLAFPGLLRFDELSKLHLTDLTLDKDKLTIKIWSSKTAQLRKGDEVVIARVGSASMLEKYLSLEKISLSDSKYMFRGITTTKSGESLRASGSLTYSRLRELLRIKLAQLGCSLVSIVYRQVGQ